MSDSHQTGHAALDADAFVARYGGIYENSPWVAEAVYDEAITVSDTAQLADLFAECVDNVSRDERLELIRAHPDLAGRAAVVGELTSASKTEQVSAGIDQCTAEEFARFQDLNDRYKEKFSFPFVMAVRNSDRHAILNAFERRMRNNLEVEFETAITEIHKIAKLRLAEIDHEY